MSLPLGVFSTYHFCTLYLLFIILMSLSMPHVEVRMETYEMASRRRQLSNSTLSPLTWVNPFNLDRNRIAKESHLQNGFYIMFLKDTWFNDWKEARLKDAFNALSLAFRLSGYPEEELLPLLRDAVRKLGMQTKAEFIYNRAVQPNLRTERQQLNESPNVYLSTPTDVIVKKIAFSPNLELLVLSIFIICLALTKQFSEMLQDSKEYVDVKVKKYFLIDYVDHGFRALNVKNTEVITRHIASPRVCVENRKTQISELFPAPKRSIFDKLFQGGQIQPFNLYPVAHRVQRLPTVGDSNIEDSTKVTSSQTRDRNTPGQSVLVYGGCSKSVRAQTEAQDPQREAYHFANHSFDSFHSQQLQRSSRGANKDDNFGTRINDVETDGEGISAFSTTNTKDAVYKDGSYYSSLAFNDSSDIRTHIEGNGCDPIAKCDQTKHPIANAYYLEGINNGDTLTDRDCKLNGATSVAHQQKLSNGATFAAQQYKLSNGATSAAQKYQLSNGATSAAQQYHLSNGATSAAQKYKLSNGATSAAQKHTLSNGATSAAQQYHLSNGATSAAQKYKLSNGATSAAQQIKLSNGATAVEQYTLFNKDVHFVQHYELPSRATHTEQRDRKYNEAIHTDQEHRHYNGTAQTNQRDMKYSPPTHNGQRDREYHETSYADQRHRNNSRITYTDKRDRGYNVTTNHRGRKHYTGTNHGDQHHRNYKGSTYTSPRDGGYKKDTYIKQYGRKFNRYSSTGVNQKRLQGQNGNHYGGLTENNTFKNSLSIGLSLKCNATLQNCKTPLYKDSTSKKHYNGSMRNRHTRKPFEGSEGQIYDSHTKLEEDRHRRSHNEFFKSNDLNEKKTDEQVQNNLTERKADGQFQSIPSETKIIKNFQNDPFETIEYKHSKSTLTETKSTEVFQQNPTEIKTTDVFQNDPSEIDTTEVFQNDPSEIKVTENFQNDLTQTKATENLKNDPTQTKANENCLNDLSDTNATEVYQKDPFETKATEDIQNNLSESNATDDFQNNSSDTKANEDYPKDRTETKATEYFQNDYCEANAAEDFQNDPSDTNATEDFQNAPSDTKATEFFLKDLTETKDDPSDTNATKVFQKDPFDTKATENFQNDPSDTKANEDFQNDHCEANATEDFQSDHCKANATEDFQNDHCEANATEDFQNDHCEANATEDFQNDHCEANATEDFQNDHCEANAAEDFQNDFTETKATKHGQNDLTAIAKNVSIVIENTNKENVYSGLPKWNPNLSLTFEENKNGNSSTSSSSIVNLENFSTVETAAPSRKHTSQAVQVNNYFIMDNTGTVIQSNPENDAYEFDDITTDADSECIVPNCDEQNIELGFELGYFSAAASPNGNDPRAVQELHENRPSATQVDESDYSDDLNVIYRVEVDDSSSDIVDSDLLVQKQDSPCLQESRHTECYSMKALKLDNLPAHVRDRNFLQLLLQVQLLIVKITVGSRNHSAACNDNGCTSSLGTGWIFDKAAEIDVPGTTQKGQGIIYITTSGQLVPSNSEARRCVVEFPPSAHQYFRGRVLRGISVEHICTSGETKTYLKCVTQDVDLACKVNMIQEEIQTLSSNVPLMIKQRLTRMAFVIGYPHGHEQALSIGESTIIKRKLVNDVYEGKQQIWLKNIATCAREYATVQVLLHTAVTCPGCVGAPVITFEEVDTRANGQSGYSLSTWTHLGVLGTSDIGCSAIKACREEVLNLLCIEVPTPSQQIQHQLQQPQQQPQQQLQQEHQQEPQQQASPSTHPSESQNSQQPERLQSQDAQPLAPESQILLQIPVCTSLVSGHSATGNGPPSQPPSYPVYITLSKRLQSFDLWPARSVHTAIDLATNGFFYAGYSDCVRCFQCGLGLRSWKPGDDIIQEHERFRSGCPFLLSVTRAAESRWRDGFGAHPPEASRTPPTSQAGACQGGAGNEQQSCHSQDQDHSQTSHETAQKLPQSTLNHITPIQIQATVMVAQLANPFAHRADSDNGYSEDLISPEDEQSCDHQQENSETMSISEESNVNISTTEESNSNNNIDASSAAQALTARLLQTENRKLQDLLTCKVCHLNPIKALFLPCGDLYACESCSNDLSHCPQCKTRILGTVTTFFA